MDYSIRKKLTTQEICSLMPKVELHAHLNGSISDTILQKLKQLGSNPNFKVNKNGHGHQSRSEADETGANTIFPDIQAKGNLTECWIAFGKIHEAIRTPEILFQATVEVIKEFVLDNVIYLEIRTTPKKIHEIASKKIYIETVIKAINNCIHVEKLPIMVKLLISIDRANSARDSLENVCLAQWYKILYPKVVAGMDLCGDPRKSDTKKTMFIVNFVKKMGLTISIHLPEVVNIKETKTLLESFNYPDRLAHGQFVHPSTGGNTELWNLLKKSGACMEVCITSNIVSGVSTNFEEHYVKLLYEDSIPFTIGTDDMGVFKSRLSNEFKLLLHLIPEITLKSFCISSTRYIFGNNEEKTNLSNQIEKWWNENV